MLFSKRPLQLAVHLVGLALLMSSPLTATAQDLARYGDQNAARAPQEGNPIIPGLFADPAVAKFGDTFYLYSTTDGFGGETGRWVVWKSKDFVHWSFSGQSFPEITGQANWAPGKPIFHRNRYWMPFTWKGSNNFLAVADKPEGPFQFANNKQPLTPSIDAELFKDDDGQVYLISGNVKPVIHRMKGDMSGVDGPPLATLDYNKGYIEGAFLFKRRGLYYAGAANLGYAEYRNVYAMSPNISGPYTYPTDNIILEPLPADQIWGTGHGQVLNIDGKDNWIMVYLRSRMGERVDPYQGEGNVNRQVCAERFSFNSDGTIKPFQPTRQGVGLLARSTNSAPNIALGKTASASSSLPLYRAEKALDGGFGTRWIVGQQGQLVSTAETLDAEWRYTTQTPPNGWANPDFDDSTWQKGKAGFGTPDTPGAIVGTRWDSGDIWMRREFTLSEADLKQELQLRAHHDNEADIYLNGVRAANLEGFTSTYETIEIDDAARAALKVGKNVMVVHCHQAGGGQFIDAGITGSAPAWWKVDLGQTQRVGRTEISFNYPTEITPYLLEWSTDDQTWHTYADHREDMSYESPKVDRQPIAARYLRVSFPRATRNRLPAGLWEFKAFSSY